MTFWNSVAGMLEGELTGAEPGKSLQMITDRGIRLYDIRWEGELSVRFCFFRRDRAVIAALCERRGDRFRLNRRRGLYWTGFGLLRRPVLLTGMLLGFFLTLWLPTRVLFLSVEGNQAIPARQILEAAAECGIRFGASRRTVRSERMKNALLGALPELQWAGVNTAGCTAVISVREREPEPQTPQSLSFSHVVALRDGYITSCTATRGNLLCAPGQVVQEGQLLISGFTDCGICIRAEAAEGEIFAQTRREIRAVTPTKAVLRQTEGETKRLYSLILGKKRINLWKDSGIWDATCGRMYEEYYITLPGGFRLPITLAVETITGWETARGDALPGERELLDFARSLVSGQMTAGQILWQDAAFASAKGLLTLDARFLCEEMIGRVITEEIGDTNGKTD